VRLEFVVGQQERHLVAVSYDKFFGKLDITVDGAPLVSDFRLGSVKLVKTYDFVVGVHERHAVRVEKTRKLFLAAFRPQVCRAYVDGQLTAEGVA
jgi:hypothetical protein